MELDLPKRGEPEPQLALVTKRIRDANGLPIGKVSDNPILDTRMYKVKYVDNEIFALSANLILEEKNCADKRRGKPPRANRRDS